MNLNQFFNKIEKYINSSVNILVFKNGKKVIDKCAGNRINFNGNKKLANKETIYDLASNTKIYVGSFLVQYLISKNKLKLNTKISDIFKNGFYNHKTKQMDKSGIFGYTGSLVDKIVNIDKIDVQQNARRRLKLINILEHTSGYPPEVFAFSENLFKKDVKTKVNQIKVNGKNIKFNQIKSNNKIETISKIINEYPLIRNPGEEYIYSDVNYMLLTAIIETIAKKNIDDLFYEITKKHGINLYFPSDLKTNNVAATEFNGSERTNRVDKSKNLRRGLIFKEVNDEKAFYLMEQKSTHASLFSNKYELMKLLTVLKTGAINNKQIIRKKVLKKFRKKSKNFPWQSLSFFRKTGTKGKWEHLFCDEMSTKTYGHSGWTGIFSAFDLREGIDIIILTNKKHSKFVDAISNECEDDLSEYTNYSKICSMIYKEVKKWY